MWVCIGPYAVESCTRWLSITIIVACSVLWPGLKDHVKWRLGRAAKTLQATGGDYIPQPFFSRLCAQRETYFLGQRSWRADQRRGPVEGPPDRIQILFNLVSGKRLDDHPGSVAFQCAANMGRRADRIAHIVQAIEKRYEVVVL